VKASQRNAQTGWRKDSPLRRALPPFLFLVMPLSLAQQSPVSSETGTISVDVNLVELHVTARDRSGNFVTGLRKEDFRVFEDGQIQTIRLFQHQDIPVSVGLILDNSTSMGRKRKDVTEAALAFVRSSNPRDEVFVVNFNERVALGLPAEKPFTADAAELERALNGVPARGRTALYDAIHTGLTHLKNASHERKILIVISDGGDNASSVKLAQVLAEMERSDISIYTIGLFDDYDEDRNPAVLKTIARTTGGEVFLPHELEEVVPICERIAAEIRNQYTIGYAPSLQALDNTYRRIRLTATSPRGGRVIVNTRDGYIASPKRERER
jgi:Ca-activated chloride channel homolog